MSAPFGPRLRWIRQRRLMTVRELGRRAGISAPHVVRLEHGAHRPKPATVKKLAAALNVDPAWLLFGEETTTLKTTEGAQ